jgi:hypothetical protein
MSDGCSLDRRFLFLEAPRGELPRIPKRRSSQNLAYARYDDMRISCKAQRTTNYREFSNLDCILDVKVCVPPRNIGLHVYVVYLAELATPYHCPLTQFGLRVPVLYFRYVLPSESYTFRVAFIPFALSWSLTTSANGSVICSPSFMVAGKGVDSNRGDSRELLGTAGRPLGIISIPVIVTGRYPTLVIVSCAIS